MFLLPLQPLFRVNVFIVLTCSTLQTIAARGVLKKDVFKNFAKLTGKQPRQRLFFCKVAGLIPATSLKEKLCYRRFPVNFAKF